MYKQPIVEQTQMMPSSMVMSGSGAGNGIQNGGTTTTLNDITGGNPPIGD